MQLLTGHRRVVHSVAFSPDGTQLASGSGDRTIRLWDLSTGQSRILGQNHGVMGNKVAFSPDGRWLAAVHNHRVRIYDLANGEQTHVLGDDDPSGSVQAVVFSSAGNRFAAGGNGGTWNRWRLWNPSKWNEAATPDAASRIKYICNLAFSPGGDAIAVVGFSEMLLCELAGGGTLGSCSVKTSGTVPTMPLAFSPDGRLLVFGHTSSLTVWNVVSRQVIGELRLEKKHFQDAACSPEGRVLTTVSNEEMVRCWDVGTWKERRSFAWEIGKLKCITFAPDGLRAAVGGDKGKIVLWDVEP